jgi:hypothetical protein
MTHMDIFKSIFQNHSRQLFYIVKLWSRLSKLVKLSFKIGDILSFILYLQMFLDNFHIAINYS